MERTARDDVRVFDSVSTASRHYLAAEHLWSALHNARRAKSLEDARAEGVAFSAEHRSCVMAALLSAVAFLEALVNEVFEDAVDRHKHGAVSQRLDPLGARCIELMAEAWPASEKGLQTLDKYQLSLLFAAQERFETGANPYQDVASAISIRNELIHFKPRWHHHDGIERLEQRLSGKFELNPYLTGTGNPWFPGKVLSAGCAAWAAAACRELAGAWCDRLGLPRQHEESLAVWEAP